MYILLLLFNDSVFSPPSFDLAVCFLSQWEEGMESEMRDFLDSPEHSEVEELVRIHWTKHILSRVENQNPSEVS